MTRGCRADAPAARRGSWWAVAAVATLATLPILAGCGPAPVESFGPAPSATGEASYWVEGYTRPGQITSDYGEGYAESFARQICPGAFVVERVDTRPVRNAFDAFLYWQALVTCRDGPADTDQPPGPTPLAPDG